MIQIEFTGRQVAITPAIRKIGEECIGRIAKLLGRTAKVHVKLCAEKHRFIAELTVHSRGHAIVSVAEAASATSALRDAITKVETQVVRSRKKVQAVKRHSTGKPAFSDEGQDLPRPAERKEPPARKGKPARLTVSIPVHAFPAKAASLEPHILRSSDSVALRPMTIEEAVKEAEFRNRDVFVFRDNGGQACVLHRRRDGKIELIEIP